MKTKGRQTHCDPNNSQKRQHENLSGLFIIIGRRNDVYDDIYWVLVWW